MHRFRSVSYTGMPVDGWDFVHSPDIRPWNATKGGKDLPDLVLKEEEEKTTTNTFKLVRAVKRIVIMNQVVTKFKSTVTKSQRLYLTFWILVTIICGCAATVPCEFILKEDNMGTRINVLATYVFVIATTSPLFSSTHKLSERHIPLIRHLMIVCTTLGYNILLTYAFTYHLPINLALILKNGSLVFQMCTSCVCRVTLLLFSETQTFLLSSHYRYCYFYLSPGIGYVLEGETYNKIQIGASISMTFGIILTVFANTKKKVDNNTADLVEVNKSDLLISVSMMLFAMLCRSLGNVVLQRTYKKYGKHVSEVMFYQHALGLPFLLWSGGNELKDQMWRWTQISSHEGTIVPRLYVLLFAVMILNFCVTKSCAQVVGLSNPVMLNLVLTIQRFCSIVFSAAYLNAPPFPPKTLWVGSFFVIIGCVAFFTFDETRSRIGQEKKKKKKEKEH